MTKICDDTFYNVDDSRQKEKLIHKKNRFFLFFWCRRTHVSIFLFSSILVLTVVHYKLATINKSSFFLYFFYILSRYKLSIYKKKRVGELGFTVLLSWECQ
jgi:hypothetical protein